MKYAAETTVSVAQSKAEIEATLSRYGATGFCSGWSGELAVIMFEMEGRRIKFTLPLPDKMSFAKGTKYSKPYTRTPEEVMKAWEQACRQRWRALALAVKAKLEMVDTGISSFEEEFLAHIVLPDGGTVGDWMRPQIDEAYKSGKMPPLLPSPQKMLPMGGFQ